jgi:hypothetical protein
MSAPRFRRLPYRHGLRSVFAVLGVAGIASSQVLSGCGTSSAPPASTAQTDSGGYVTVVTSGGGPVPTGNLLQPPPPDSGSSSGGASSSGGDDASSAVDSSGDAPDGCPVAEASTTDAAYTAPQCGLDAGACDLHSNTCCLTTSLGGTCLPGANATCPSSQATVHCLEGEECPCSTSCCGDIITILGEVKSRCVPLVQGQSCPFVPWTNTQLGVQLCKTDDECKNGQPCIHQMCAYGAVLYMCGLQPDMPLNCVQIP